MRSGDDVITFGDGYARLRIIDEAALPAGLFRGSSKFFFDTLDRRQQQAEREGAGSYVRASYRELLSMTGLRSVNTLKTHIRYFSALGLLRVERGGQGEHAGNFYRLVHENLPAAIERAKSEGRRYRLHRRRAVVARPTPAPL